MVVRYNYSAEGLYLHFDFTEAHIVYITHDHIHESLKCWS